MEQKSTFWKSAMTYGLYLGVALILFSVIFYVMGMIANPVAGYINMVVMIAGMVVAQVFYRKKEMGGYISYGQAVGFGTAVVVFAGILTSLYTVVLYKFIDPGLLDQVKRIQEEAMLAKGVSEAQIEAMSSMMDKTRNPIFMAASGLFGSALIGLILSLISSIFIKKEADMDAFDEAMEEVKTEEE